jgi:hypothetical protein
VIDAIPDMPAGTLGFRTSGEITADDYRDVVLPALRSKVDAQEALRVLCVVGDGLTEKPAAAWEAAKADADIGIKHRDLWKRVAVVTDHGWIRRATSLFGGLAPCEMKAFSEGDLEEARAWVAEVKPA